MPSVAAALSILHVISNLATPYGGPVQVCRDIAKRQAAAGHHVEIFTTNIDYPAKIGNLDVPTDRPVEVDGYIIRYFPVDFRPLLFSWSMHRALGRQTSRFDIVHVHGIYRLPNYLGAHHARRAAVPYWVRPYGSLDPFLFNKPERRRLKRIYERFFVFPMLEQASAIHFTTEDERISTAFLGLATPGVVLPNGLSVEMFQSLPPAGRFRAAHGIAPEQKLLIHFGRLTMKKGIDQLVAAVGRLRPRHPDLRLAIIGPDNEGFTTSIRGWLSEHRIEDITILPGMLTGEAKLEALRDADVFALPSYAENFGVAVIEAMAAGVPVVISDRVGIWNEVVAAAAGIVVPVSQLDALTNALDLLLTDEARRKDLGFRGREFALDYYAWDRIIPRIEEQYRRTIATHSRLASPGRHRAAEVQKN